MRWLPMSCTSSPYTLRIVARLALPDWLGHRQSRACPLPLTEAQAHRGQLCCSGTATGLGMGSQFREAGRDLGLGG